MSVISIVLLIILGIFLLLVEFFIIPGINVAGIGGVLLIIGGIFMTYQLHGPVTGTYVLAGSLILTLIILYFALRSSTWKKLMLHTEIDGKVNTIEKNEIKPGDKGYALTRLAPIGRVQIKDIDAEGKSIAGFIDENTEVIVVKITGSQIIVKPKNKS
ncbi:MAG: NfeD family protein [Bacteroidota bacterium]|nr:NfeD family protein [Bacteroidota bacterium]MDP4225563.1 NfeD family protein [Bacteroidota bacterium]MDP4272736.1 NfeD family protein [Bacteroidota bacterium]